MSPRSQSVRRAVLAAATLALGAATLAAGPASANPHSELAPGAHPAANAQASDRVVYNYDRSESAARAAKPVRPGSTPNMTYHGGKIMTQALSRAIFWGPSWANSAFTADKRTGLDTWYSGYGGSHYAAASTQYTDAAGVYVGSAVTHQGSVVDLSTASGGGSSAAILAEVGKMFPASELSSDGYYPVYTDLPRGSARYCAWHSSGTVNGVQVQFAFFWSLDGDPGCDPGDTSGLHSQGLAALANVSGHELAEAMTDPASPGAWYDGSGSENGDKCAWTFGAPLVNFLNGSQWKIQGEWSNVDYTAQTGYPNSSGQKGCLSGA